MAGRILFVFAGIMALVMAAIITLGAALAGALTVGIAAYLLRRRGKQLTRRTAWLASVAGTMFVMAIAIGKAMIEEQRIQKAVSAVERESQLATATRAMPEWVRTMNPTNERRAAMADSLALQMLDNKAIRIWASLLGAVIASTVIGTIAGSFGWGGVMLLHRGLLGRWMAPAQPDPLTGL